MLYLRSADLRVALLHPQDDRQRLGFRYVGGGYIYQVEDPRLGPLLSGPVFPAPWPPVFDGQGLPDAFRAVAEARQGLALVPGAGLVRPRERQVVEFCEWEIETGEARARMRTAQHWEEFSFALERQVTLAGRVLTSSTRLENSGAPLPFSWYAHPFFPLRPDGRCCAFAFPVRLDENPGFRLGADDCIEMKAEHDWQRGHFQLIEDVQGHLLSALQHHPVLDPIRVEGDFPLSRMPIWANACTVSFEPFHEGEIPPGQERAWSLTYTF